MAIPDQIQTLLAAFIFGLLFQTATAAILLYFKGHGASIFDDRRRLALLFFLGASAFWVQIDFINFAIPASSPVGCQATIVLSTLFDQVARVTIGGFLLWSVGHSIKSAAERYGLGALIGVRAVVGVVFVGFTRPQFAPVCVARSSMLLVSITLIVLDIIILGVLTIRIFTLGLLDDIREVRPSTKQEQGKAFVFCTAGLALWTVTSAAMMLGMDSIILILRTALPAIGLMVLISIMAIYPGALVLPRDEDSRTPEARSPFVARPSRSIDSYQENNGSPISENEYSKTTNLFVANPSATPSDSPTVPGRRSVKVDDKAYMRQPSIAISAVQAESSSSFNISGLEQVQMSGGNLDAGVAAPLGATASALFLAVPRKAPQAPSGSQNIIRSAPTIVVPRDSSPSDGKSKKSLFGWPKQSVEKSVLGLTISNPIMENSGVASAQLLTRIKTVDLATAAATERERREASFGRPLIAQRPAPRPPTMSASNIIRRDSNIRRKEVASSYYQAATKASRKISTDSNLSVLVNASSTSASLSPGREDVRRRSPRVLKSHEDELERSASAESHVRNGVNGLPVNPRARPLRSNEARQQDYEPALIDIIKSGAKGSTSPERSEQLASAPNFAKLSEPTSDSILNRPRPRRQNPGNDDAPQRHARSKSSSSAISKKSLMKSLPNSPTDLPALPPLPRVPTTASRLQKILPSNTKDLTIDERISMLFPAPPGTLQPHRRRSSVPSLPRIPSSVFLGDSLVNLLSDQQLLERRASKRSTISFGGQAATTDGVTPIVETPIINDYGIFRFTAKTYQTGVEASKASIRKSAGLDTTRPRQSASTESSSEADGFHEGSKSVWGSIHSPVPAIDVANAKRTARETYIKTRNGAPMESSSVSETQMSGDGEGLMTVMLGVEEITFPNRQSVLLDQSSEVLKAKAIFPPNHYPWHRRIGDELPAFSQRRKRLRSRTMPPPTPLLLKTRGKQSTIQVAQPVVETILASPGAALREIQAQLKKFEVPGRDSLGTLIQNMPPAGSSKRSSAVNDDKLGLLANLEMEMGQQESMWMQMQHNFDRDSNSVIMSPQMAEITAKPLPSPPSEASSNRSSLNLQNDAMIIPRGTLSKLQQPGPRRASIWERRLSKAQRKYVGSASALSAKQNADFFAVAKGQLGSPTPPESVDSQSDSGEDMEHETDDNIYEDYIATEPASPELIKATAALWKPTSVAPIVTIGALWCPVPKETTVHIVSAEPAGRTLKAALRRDLHPLPISSSKLWSPPSIKTDRSPVGLWGSRVTRPASVITRPKTQRPQRKSKRYICLPDILESPSPLPHKRDTLGIFQFPWGEKSDSAVYKPLAAPYRPPSINPFLMNPIIEANVRQPDPELTEYSSSFFDDYDDDYDNYGEDEDAETLSDDDFDESTLWEIATLLNSEDVPSRNSLLPLTRIIEDYDDSEDSELDIVEQTARQQQQFQQQAQAQTIVRPSMVKFIPIQPLKPTAPAPTSTVESTPELAIVPSPTGVWQAYLPSLDEAVRADSPEEVVEEVEEEEEEEESSSEEVPIVINPRQLWDKAFGAVCSLPVEKATTLWSQKNVESTPSSLPTLWTAREEQMVTDVVGLFAAGIHRTDYRTSYEAPAAISTNRKRRVDNSPLSAVTSQQLWFRTTNTSFERHWISESSIRARSPSLGSASSSGRSTPSSDDASAVSTNTKASSIWSAEASSAAEASKIPIWHEGGKVTRDVAIPVEAEMIESPLSYLPSREQKRAVSVRGSNVLASREMWESRAPILDAHPSKKTWRASKVVVPVAFQERKVPMKKKTTAAEWDMALEEAISQGQMPTSTTADQEALESNQLWTSSASTVSPSAPSSVGLWTAQSASPATVLPTLWNAISKPGPVRKASLNQPPVTLPSLSSISFWQQPLQSQFMPSASSASSSSGSSRHWLHTTSLHSSTPEDRHQRAEQEQLHGQEQAHESSAALELLLANTFLDFTPSVPVHPLQRSNTTTLSTLSSSTMFSRQNITSNTDAGAAQRTSIWTPPQRAKMVSGRERRAGLWMGDLGASAGIESRVDSGEAQVQTETKRRRRSSAAAAQEMVGAGLTGIRDGEGKEEEKRLWRPQWGLPGSPKQWLREGSKRSRKVEFRY